MIFSSIHFLFLFLPIFLILYYLLPYKWWRNTVLCIASLVFFVWADPNSTHWLLITILLNYLFGILIETIRTRNHTSLSRAIYLVSLIYNIGVLFFYKYSSFSIHNIDSLFGLTFNPRLPTVPIGISYLVFSSISCLVDIHNETEKAEKNILRFSNFLIMFPKLFQGPITRISQVQNELAEKWLVNENFSKGVKRFISGLAKKALLADNLAIVTERVFLSNFTSLAADVAWMGLLCYTLQIFFDFAGYTDMALGLAKMLGYNLPENFNYPYISRSITDFWRRWHMSLTAWFRTYLFLPLEFKRRHSKFLRQQTNLLIVFLLTGLWHGANWNFLIWGGYFGSILAIEASGFGKMLKKLPAFVQHIYSLFLILTGWIFFKITDLSLWGSFFKALIGGNGLSTQVDLRYLNIVQFIPLMVIAILFATPLPGKLETWITSRQMIGRWIILTFYIILFGLSTSYLLANGYNSFLYAQF